MRILVFGDSIVRGSYDDQSGGWVNQFSTYCNNKSVEENGYFLTYNLGIAAETAAELVDRICTELPSRIVASDDEEVVIVIASGINDSKYHLNEECNHTYIGDFKRIYKDMLQEALKHTEHVFSLGLTIVDEAKTDPLPSNSRVAYRNKDIKDYETVIKGVASEYDVRYIDIRDLLTPGLLTDGIHPNAEGHRLIFERVKKVLKEEGIL